MEFTGEEGEGRAQEGCPGMIGACVQPAFEQTASCVGVPQAKAAPGEAGLLFPENAGFLKSIFLNIMV